MTLLSVRDQFLKESGRYDLGTRTSGAVSGVDDGADFYINAGQRWLDRRVPNNMMKGVRPFVLAVGEYLMLMDQAKSIENVWMVESDGTSTELDRKDFETIRNYYGEKLSVMDNGTTAYWAPATSRLDPNLQLQDVDIALDDMGDYIIDTGARSHAIVMAPPTDTSVTIEVYGTWFSPVLTENGDVSIWTRQFPEALVMAGQRQLEIAHRNTEGAKDWERAIDVLLMEIDMSDVTFDNSHIDQMEG